MAKSVNAVIGYSPPAVFLAQDDAFRGGRGLLFKRSLEEDALVFSVGRAAHFFRERSSDKDTGFHAAQRFAAAVHRASELAFRARYAKARGFAVEGLAVFVRVEKLKPLERSSPGCLLVRASFGAGRRAQTRSAGAEGKQQRTGES